MSPKLLFSVLSVSFLGIVSGTWYNPYPNEIQNLVCRCGEYVNVVSLTFPLSPEKDNPSLGFSLYGLFRFSNGDPYCAKYRNCRECYPNGGLKCKSCPPQKFGRFCEKDCDCQNGASCERNGKCLCRYGFGGPKCERLDCDCQNGGSCEKNGKCLCRYGFEGPKCERLSCGCQNGGSCKRNGKCLCRNGFKGPKCEKLNCDCQNGGSCKKNGKCSCRYGFEGPKCERLNCDCQNGGSCKRNGRCSCRYGFEGPKCERLRCGQPYSRRTPLIRYGNVTKIGQWPWQAILFIYDQHMNITVIQCGGSLLNDLWVMTAAHCLTYQSHSGFRPKEEFRVLLGKYYRKISKNDKRVQKPQIEEMYVYPKYNKETRDGDIALIKLKKPVRMTKRVQPVCLPTPKTSERNIVHGKMGVVTGWGLNEHSKLTETLEEAAIPVITGNYCKKQPNGNGGYLTADVTENMFCAGYFSPNAPDSDRGDSGGPVVFLDPFSRKKRWVIEGIVSFANFAPTENGAYLETGVYTRVSKFLAWIESYIGKPRTSVDES